MLVIPAVQLPLILIFYILLGGSFLLQPGVAVSVPSSPFVLSSDKDPLLITIPPPPSSAIYLENRQLQFADLRNTLENHRNKPRPVVLRGDKNAPYERIFSIMNLALEMGFPVILAASEEPDSP